MLLTCSRFLVSFTSKIVVVYNVQVQNPKCSASLSERVLAYCLTRCGRARHRTSTSRILVVVTSLRIPRIHVCRLCLTNAFFLSIISFSVLGEESTNHYVYNQLPRVNNFKGCAAHLIELLINSYYYINAVFLTGGHSILLHTSNVASIVAVSSIFVLVFFFTN